MPRGTLLALVLACASVAVAAEPAPEEWHLTLTPYLLLPGVDAYTGIRSPDGTPDVDSGPSDILSLINFTVMLKAEAQSGRRFMLVDWLYLDMGNVDSTVRAIEFPDGIVPISASVMLDSDASFDGFMVMLGGGYRVVDDPAWQFDAYGGLRTLNLSSSLRWSFTTSISSPGGAHSFPASGEVASNSEVWDAVLGARGAWLIDERWRLFGVADYGWGDHSRSWQWTVGISLRGESTSVELAWRELAWLGLGDDQQARLRLFGPAIGATFRF